MAQQQSENYTVVATKMSPASVAQLEMIAAARGLSKYELIQMACDTLIRYMSDQHNLTPEMEQAMSIFEHMQGWQSALNLADPTAAKEIAEATYYLVDPEGQKHGCRAVHVSRPFFGDWSQNTNIQQILERTLCNLFPERYQRLRALAVDLDCTSILELMDKLIDMHAADGELADLRKPFEDARRSVFGTQPVDAPYRRHNRRSMESMERNIFADAD